MLPGPWEETDQTGRVPVYRWVANVSPSFLVWWRVYWVGAAVCLPWWTLVVGLIVRCGTVGHLDERTSRGVCVRRAEFRQ